MFKAFLDPLKKVLRLGRSRPEAWRNLLTIVTDDPDEFDFCDDTIDQKLSISHLNKIFNGTEKISAHYAAQIMDAGFSPQYLTDRIDELPDQAKDYLLSEYLKLDPSMTIQTLAQWCADTLTKLILEPIPSNDVRKKRIQQNLYQHLNKKINSNMKAYLLTETHGICPVSGCNRPLLRKKDTGDTYEDFEVIKLKPTIPAKVINTDSLIAVCSSCAKKYDWENANKLSQLQQNKENLQRRTFTLSILQIEHVEIAIKQILVKLQSLPQQPEPFDEKIDGPISIAKKIPDNLLLRQRIQSSVIHWFKAIQALLQALDSSSDIRFEDIKCTMRQQYLKLRRHKLSQQEILESLLSYLRQTTAESPEACEIFIAYFIQSCEVFDATA